jgi:hypothetical protein
MKNGVFWDVTRATRRNIPEDTVLNRIKSLWGIIKAATNTNSGNNSVPSINVEGKLCNNIQIGAN